jgi:hypothetical protein
VEAVNTGGISEHHESSLERVLQQADALNGLVGIEAVDTARDFMKKIKQKNGMIEGLKAAVNRGGWFNSNVKSGSYDKYQATATIDRKNLELAFVKTSKLEGRMKTRGGKMYFKLASLLLNLREKVAEAVATNDPGAWRQVEKVPSQVDLSENSKA